MKKIISLVLVLALLVSTVPLALANGDSLILVGGDDYVEEPTEFEGELPDVGIEDIMPLSTEYVPTLFGWTDWQLAEMVANTAYGFYAAASELSMWDMIAIALAHTAAGDTELSELQNSLETAVSKTHEWANANLVTTMWQDAAEGNWSATALNLILAMLTQPSQIAYIDIVARALAAAQNGDGSWSAYGDADLSTTIFAVHALNILGTEFDRDAAAAWFATVQKEDGGFSYMGDEGDVDMTAMALLALGVLADTDMTAAALDMVLSRMTEQGGFVSQWSETGDCNSNTVATVINGVLASGLEVDEETMTLLRENLLTFAREEGGFAYEASDTESNAMSTAQALISLCELATGVPYSVTIAATNTQPDNSAVVDAIAHIGLMVGDSNGFRAADRITNAELAIVMARHSAANDAEGDHADLPADAWYTPAMTFMRNNGLLLGAKPNDYADRYTVYQALNLFTDADLPLNVAALSRLAPPTRLELALHMLECALIHG